MSKLAPARIAGLVMGVWFLALRSGTTWPAWPQASTRRCRSPTLFTLVTATALGSGVVLVLLIRPIRRMLER